MIDRRSESELRVCFFECDQAMIINSRFWIVFMCLGFIANPCSGLAQSMDGYWLGEMEAGGRLLRFLLESAESQDAAAEVTLVSWDEGHRRFPLQDFQLGRGELRFELPTTKAKYVGKLDPTGKIAEGAWQQRGSEFPLRFEWHENMPVDQPTEIWEGTIRVGFQKLVMRFRGYKAGDSTVYFVDSVTQKAGGFVAKGGWQDSTLELSIPALGGTFRGERSPGGDELAGKWSQGIPLDLVMQRVSSPPSTLEGQPPRPQTPQSPFPYKSQEVSFLPKRLGGMIGLVENPRSSCFVWSPLNCPSLLTSFRTKHIPGFDLRILLRTSGKIDCFIEWVNPILISIWPFAICKAF